MHADLCGIELCFYWRQQVLERCQLLYKKSDAARYFVLHKAKTEVFHLKNGYTLMTVKHNCGELTLKGFIAELEKNRVESNFAAPYTPQQDRFTKILNEIIVNDTNSMMKTVRYSPSFLVAAIKRAIYIQNRLPSKVFV